MATSSGRIIHLCISDFVFIMFKIKSLICDFFPLIRAYIHTSCENNILERCFSTDTMLDNFVVVVVACLLYIHFSLFFDSLYLFTVHSNNRSWWSWGRELFRHDCHWSSRRGNGRWWRYTDGTPWQTEPRRTYKSPHDRWNVLFRGLSIAKEFTVENGIR